MIDFVDGYPLKPSKNPLIAESSIKGKLTQVRFEGRNLVIRSNRQIWNSSCKNSTNQCEIWGVSLQLSLNCILGPVVQNRIDLAKSAIVIQLVSTPRIHECRKSDENLIPLAPRYFSKFSCVVFCEHCVPEEVLAVGNLNGWESNADPC